MSDRGIKKWAPYKSLKEQWSTLDDVHEKSERVEKPTISSEEAEEINEILVNYHGQELVIEYYRNGQILKEVSVIKKIDSFEKKLYLVNRKVIKLNELVSIREK